MKYFAVYTDEDGEHKKEFVTTQEAWSYLEDIQHGWMKDVEDEYGESVDSEN